MKIALAQLNPTIGDVDANVRRVLDAITAAEAAAADLVVLPEQALIGYPAKDLLLRRDVINQNVASLERIREASARIAVLVGWAEPNPQPRGRPLWNAAALLAGGKRGAAWRKRLLPTYDVFDEVRYFEPAGPQPVVALGEERLAVTICEDALAQDVDGRPLYAQDPIADAIEQRPTLLLNLSASPYWLNKQPWRLAKLAGHARRAGCPLVYVNQVGGNDELLFDGASCVIAADGTLLAQARSFEEDLLIVDLARPRDSRREAVPRDMEALLAALVMGVRDYVRKCGFLRVVVGLSGGVDSAVVGAIATRALGPAAVQGIAMPSRYSSEHSLTDARLLAERLGIAFSVIPIEPLHAAAEASLSPHFEGRPPDVTEENVQARLRGLALMALSNKFGALLLTTGNKSELAAGYCTLYGDMCGGLAVISDVPKTMVYELARYINATSGQPLIPTRTLERAPTAELRPNQTDQDTLPPYDVLDAILRLYDEELRSPQEIVVAGFDPQVVAQVVRLIDASEYKRRQAAPGLKVTTRAFGFGRRMPIAARLSR